jgi:hypothetical protein
MRKFKGGATRDDAEGKIDYEGFLAPIVLQRYGEYMLKHQKQADGKLRPSDNWQNLFGKDHKSVCLKSLLRHVWDVWLIHRGFDGRENIQSALCAILFNTQAYLLKVLIDERAES